MLRNIPEKRRYYLYFYASRDDRNLAPTRGLVETSFTAYLCHTTTGLAVRKKHIFFLTAQLCGPKSNPHDIIMRKNMFIATHSIAGVHKSLKKNLGATSKF
jgi:hypothetical protein